jgi:CheY-like chemotaxis protein
MNLVAETEVKEVSKNETEIAVLDQKLASYLSQISFLQETYEALKTQLQMTKQEVAKLMTDLAVKPQEFKEESTSMSDRPLEGIKVLVAEDSPDNQMLMRQYLKIAGAEVEIVDNGLEVIEKAMEDKHHLILMDVMMPVCDGYEATRTLRERGYKKPIIALTAHALREQREQSFKEGCNEHLVKPINRPLLISTIARFANSVNQ